MSSATAASNQPPAPPAPPASPAPSGPACPQRPTRASRFRQSLASFAAVMVCYWVYWLAVVPLVEPDVEDERTRVVASEEQIEAARGEVNSRQRDVARHFQPGDWEAQKPAVGRIGRMRLLFKTLETEASDGSVTFTPCTLMFFPDQDDPAGRECPIIMRAPKANVRFDRRIELATLDISQCKFVGASLVGPIRILRQATRAGADDDLEIATRDVEMDSSRAWTAAPVNFRYGRSHGSGSDLEILLGKADGQPAGDMREATFRQLQLKRDVQMLLEVGRSAAADPTAPARAPEDEPPLKITCAGRFQFEADEYAASFHDDVDVFRLNHSGASDQLSCALLTVYFARPGQAPAAPAPAAAEAATGSSQIRMIEARGDPVILRSPAQAIYARCKGLDYIPGPPGSPGSLAAFGPGVIQGVLPNDPAGKYSAQWARQLRFEPDGDLQRATLRGAAVIDFGTLGTISSDEVFAWLSRKPPAPAAAPVAQRMSAAPGPPLRQVAHHAPSADPLGAWQIDRVVARRYPEPGAPSDQLVGPPNDDANATSQGDVVIHGPQIHAVSAVLEAVVTRDVPLATPPAAVGEQPAAPPDNRQAKRGPQQPPRDRFDLAGRGVHIQLVARGDELVVSGATVLGSAVLKQFPLLAPRQAPPTLLVKGDSLRVRGADGPDTRVTIAGNPGYVEAGGMTLWGGAIEVERAANWLWIDGPGRVALPLNQDLDGRPLARPEALTVDWKQRMDFKSDTATFRGGVVARSRQQVLNAEQLAAVLDRPVDFGSAGAALDDKPGERPELATVRTFGRTFLESRQIDEAGTQNGFSQMELADLAIERRSGKIDGRGPGWVKHVARGAGPQLMGPALPGQAPPAAPPPADAPQDELTYLYVTFQQGLDGNINQRTVRFFDRTRTIYGPVQDWNARIGEHDLDALGPQGMTLDAGQLEVREMQRRPDNKRGWFELDASGGVTAEGQRFTALGQQLTYAEEKDQLILRGDPAEMFLENDSGPRHETRANEVSYWFKRHYFSVSGVRSANVVLPPPKTGDGAKPRAPAGPATP